MILHLFIIHYWFGKQSLGRNANEIRNLLLKMWVRVGITCKPLADSYLFALAK